MLQLKKLFNFLDHCQSFPNKKRHIGHLLLFLGLNIHTLKIKIVTSTFSFFKGTFCTY